MDIDPEEIHRIMKEEKIPRLTQSNILCVIRRGSSEICRLISREAELSSPHTYTMDDIAYIYGLDIDDVHRASGITGIHEATAVTLPQLFFHIPA